MKLKGLDHLGEWNPQMFRELKGLLKPRNLFLTVASSLIVQFLILMVFSQQHCLKYEVGGTTCAQLDWNFQWLFVFRTLNWLVPFLMLVCGFYLIVSDIAKEGRRGTLNFIRLSPQSSQSILSGKILGVPALVYLWVALATPLHLGSALAAGVPFLWLLGIYTLWGVGCCLFYSTACLYSLQWNSPQFEPKSLAGAGSLIACFLSIPYIGVLDFSLEGYLSDFGSGYGIGNWKWFLLPLSHQPALAWIWTLITLSVGTYWIWQAGNRIFRNSSATLLSKGQSYWLVGSFQVWLLGFVLPELGSVSSVSTDAQFAIGCFFLFGLNPGLFLVLNAALSPHRQALQDWARYRRDSRSRSKGFWNRSLVKDLVWGEKSPALVAIAINLLITSVIWVPWILLWSYKGGHHEDLKIQLALIGLLFTINSTLLYAALAELMVFVKKLNQTLLTACLVGAVCLLVLFLGIEPLKMSILWVLSPWPAIAFVKPIEATAFFLGFLAQLAILGLLTLQLTRQLQKAGESTSKVLFAESPSLPTGRVR